MKSHGERIVYSGVYSLAEYNFLFLNICYLLENQFYIETRGEFYYDVDVDQEKDWLEKKKGQWYISASFHNFEFVIRKTMKNHRDKIVWDANTSLLDMVQKVSKNNNKKFNYRYEKETDSVFFNDKKIDAFLSVEAISLLLMFECWGSDSGDFCIYFNEDEIILNATISIDAEKNLKYKLTLEDNLYLTEVFEEKVFFLYHGYEKWGVKFMKALSNVESFINKKNDEARVRDIKRGWLEIIENETNDFKDQELLKWVAQYSPHKMDETMLTVISELE